MKIIIGLGNPEEEFKQSRHNFGKLLIDRLAADRNATFKKNGIGALVAEILRGNEKIVLAKPLPYMNESGAVVAALKKRYKVKTEDIIIVHDDLDLPFGTIRLSVNESSGGHRGVANVISALGAADFVRIRLGIGPKTAPADEYVLESWNADQKKKLRAILDQAAFAATSLMSEGLPKAASTFNRNV